MEDTEWELLRSKQDNYCNILENVLTNPEAVIKRLNQQRIRLPLDDGVVDLDSLKFAAILEEAGCLGTVMHKIQALIAAEPPKDPLLPIVFNESALRIIGNALVDPEYTPAYSPQMAEQARKDCENAVKKKEQLYDELRRLTDKLEQNLKASAAIMQEKMTSSLALTVGKFKEVVAKIKHEIGGEVIDLTNSQDNDGNSEKKKNSDGHGHESARKKTSSNKADGSPKKKKSNDEKEDKYRGSKSDKGDGGNQKKRNKGDKNDKSTSERSDGANKSTSGAKKDDEDDMQSKGKIKRLG